MTFYEAALRVLESEGRPLHFLEITQHSIAQNLLSHVGKTPEQTMLSRLAAMARRARDRRLCVTAKDTFALVEWGIPEDVDALSQTGIPEPNPEEDLPPLRPVERHPEPRNDNVRAAGRTERERERRPRRDEEEGGRRRKKYPPIAEVCFEVLSEHNEPLRPDDIAAKAREKGLASDELGAERILTALLEDNQRRIDAGRRPQFRLDKGSGQISLESAGSPSEALPVELVAAFAEALGIPLEGGRPVFPSRGGTAAAAVAGLTPLAADATVEATLAAAKTAIKEYRRAVAKTLRKRLSELDAGTLEKAVVRMLHAHGFRELKVAKRSKEGPLLTARRRDGSVELRYAVRILRGNPALDRKEVKELRKDLQHYAGQVGLLCSAGEVRSEARSEGQQTQGGLVLLWCGDSLADKFLDAQAAVKVTTVEMFEIDEAFFSNAHADAEEAARRREERHKEKALREGTGEAPSRPPEEAAPRAAAAPEAATPVAAETVAPRRAPAPEQADDEDEEGEEEGDEHLDAASAFVAGEQPGAPAGEAGAGDRKRRRRRRRGRRGRGPRLEGEGAPAEGAAAAGTSAEGAAEAATPAEGAAAAATPAEGAAAAATPVEGGTAAATPVEGGAAAATPTEAAAEAGTPADGGQVSQAVTEPSAPGAGQVAQPEEKTAQQTPRAEPPAETPPAPDAPATESGPDNPEGSTAGT